MNERGPGPILVPITPSPRLVNGQHQRVHVTTKEMWQHIHEQQETTTISRPTSRDLWWSIHYQPNLHHRYKQTINLIAGIIAKVSQNANDWMEKLSWALLDIVAALSKATSAACWLSVTIPDRTLPDKARKPQIIREVPTQSVKNKILFLMKIIRNCSVIKHETMAREM